ncbi:uncharacterized protein [Dermacentor albipictus]|uniref:uncharacterized protein isoform X2 n=1 Tax=Dermacentor albipictus TaxID=60249 RepID=UPI0031FD77DD
MRRLRSNVRRPAPAEASTCTGPQQDATASPKSHLAAAATISAESTVPFTTNDLQTRTRKLDRGTASGPQLNVPASPGPFPAGLETTRTTHTAHSALSVNKQHGTPDVGPVPKCIMQQRKSITNEQLVSKLRSKHRHRGCDMVMAINEAGSQFRLPGFPRSDALDILNLGLPFLLASQQANEKLSLKKGDEVLSFRKTNVKQQDIISSEVHASAAENKGSTTSVDPHLYTGHKKNGKPHSYSPQFSRSQEALTTKVCAALPCDTVFVAPVCNLVVELDRLTAEEISAFTSHRHPSPVHNRMAQKSKDAGCCSQVTERPAPVHAARTSVPGQSQKQPLVQSRRLQDTADFKSDAMDIEEPALHEQPRQNDSQLSDQDEHSPSLLESMRSGCQKTLPSTSQKSSDVTFKKCISVRFSNIVQKKTADLPTDEHLLPAPTASEKTSQVPCREPSLLGVGNLVEPRLSEARGSGSQDSPVGAERCIIRSVSPDTLPPLKKRRVRFTALQEEALVYGVMKYGRGSWKEISNDGWFDGRHTTDLHDKYRNLEKYGHLPNVRRRVKDMLNAGVNPLKKLRALYKQQQATSLIAVEPLHGERSSVSQRQEPQRAFLSVRGPERASAAPSSDDDSLEPFQHQTEAREATSSPKTACSSADRPSASGARPSALGRWSSDTESDESQKSVPTKFKQKRRRVPFTPLEEEALVAGVLKFGKGNWVRILNEGGFLGRTGTQLSDKYRNLKLYRQLEAVEKAVKTRCARGEDPLEELRKLSATHWKR